MNVIIDTEFTDLSKHPAFISVGLISLDGKNSFYAELIDNYSTQNCSEFVHENVLPLLDADLLSDTLDYKNIYAKMTTAQCRTHLSIWISLFEEPVQIWSDAPYYDWLFIKEIFSVDFWPVNLLGLPKWIFSDDQNEIDRYKNIREVLYASGVFRRHHALHDARVTLQAFLSVNTIHIDS